MFKKSLLFFCIVMPGLIKAQDFNPKKVVPAKLANYDFGMTLDAFKAKNKTAIILPFNGNDFRIEAKDTKAGSEYKSLTYYFDNENNKPLYEIIIEFRTEKMQLDYIKQHLKTPNFEDQWKWTTKEGYVFKAWGFGSKLVFALALPSTEWDESKN